VAFRLGANLASGNITITSIVKWGTFAADVTEAMKTATITKFKEKAASWSGKFSVKVTDPVCGEKTLPINYRLLWSPTDIADAAPYSLNLYKTYPRAGVTGWNIDFGYDNSVVAASGWELAHEYGHTLCLPDEYFYAGVTAASVVYKKADGTSETITLQPATGNIMYLHSDTTYLKRFFYFTAVEAQELLRSRSGRNVICEVV
jgi:type VI secretion system secreted protein VgrG